MNTNFKGRDYDYNIDLLRTSSSKSREKIIDFLTVSEKYKLKMNYYGGFVILNPQDYKIISFSGMKGVYLIYLKVGQNFVPIYAGESKTDMRRRLDYFLRWCKGEGHPTEGHSGGQFLYDKFDGKTEVFAEHLYFNYVSLGKIRELLSDDKYVKSTLYGVEQFGIYNMPTLPTLRFIEEGVIQKYQPLSNKNSIRKGLYTRDYSHNLDLVEDFKNKCMS